MSNDPVVEPAVQKALAATKPSTGEHPALSRLLRYLIGLLFILATVAVLLGTINTFQVRSENHELRKTQSCLVNLVAKNQSDSASRTTIAAQDRAVVDRYLNTVRHSRSETERNAAYAAYVAERNADDAARAKLPTATGVVCSIKLATAKTATLPASTSPRPATGTTRATVSTPASTVTSAGGAVGTLAPSGHKIMSTHSASAAQPTLGAKRNNSRASASPTASASPSSKPLVNLPTLTLPILGLTTLTLSP